MGICCPLTKPRLNKDSSSKRNRPQHQQHVSPLRGGGRPKWQKLNRKGGPKQQQWHNQRGTSWGGWHDTSNNQQQQSQQETLNMLVQLSLCQEDAINALRMDKAFLLLFRTQGQETVVHTLFEVATAWRQKKASNKVDLPLKITLLKSPLLEFKTRLEHLVSTTGHVERMAKMGWFKKNDGRLPSWLPLAYSPETKAEVPHASLGPQHLASGRHESSRCTPNSSEWPDHAEVPQHEALAAQYCLRSFDLSVPSVGMVCHRDRLRMVSPKQSPLATRLLKMLPRLSGTWHSSILTTTVTSTRQ